MRKNIVTIVLATLLSIGIGFGAQQTILTTDTVKDALITKVQANFTELYGLLTGTGHTHATAAQGGATIAPTAITVESWASVTYVNGWVNATGYATVQYMKDPMGWVHMKGVAECDDSTGTTMFTLPTGYRPAAKEIFPPGYNPAATTVNTDGTVVHYASASMGSHLVSFSGVIFKAS